MNILQKYIDETVRAIGYITHFEYHSLISVKKIRKLYKIGPSDYSKINFYWRSLQYLEENKVIKRFGSKTPRRYQIINFLKFFNLLHDIYIDNLKLTAKTSLV
ncbi:MAG: hypothetical protein ACFFEY_16620 [Candidatus Thorarchaeota archaeon]